MCLVQMPANIASANSCFLASAFGTACHIAVRSRCRVTSFGSKNIGRRRDSKGRLQTDLGDLAPLMSTYLGLSNGPRTSLIESTKRASPSGWHP